jgi:transcriptional regulator
MYRPDPFKIADPAVCWDLMGRYPFATLVRGGGGAAGLTATHLPLLVKPKPGVGGTAALGTLFGHMARANDQWRSFADGREVLAIFHGPHAFVSASWYVARPAVPTWNYAVVHAYGVPVLMEEPTAAQALLLEMLDIFEGCDADHRPEYLAGLPLAQMAAAIVAFRIDVQRLEGKLKLSQNRTQQDRQGVIAALARSDRAEDQALAALMSASAAASEGSA